MSKDSELPVTGSDQAEAVLSEVPEERPVLGGRLQPKTSGIPGLFKHASLEAGLLGPVSATPSFVILSKLLDFSVPQL